MKVLIVGKTRQGSAACVGCITFDGRSVRLCPHDPAAQERWGLDFELGEVWDVEGRSPARLLPPHVENLEVHSRRRMGSMPQPVPFIERHMPPVVGGPEILYEGLARPTPSGALSIAEDPGVPSFSTQFWRPNLPLHRDDDGKRLRYRYATPDGSVSLVYVGFQDPVAEIPAGTLLRISLSHWWRPEDKPEWPERCWVQLSGWFLDKGVGRSALGVGVMPAPVEKAVPASSEGPVAAPASGRSRATERPEGPRATPPALPPETQAAPVSEGTLRAVVAAVSNRPADFEPPPPPDDDLPPLPLDDYAPPPESFAPPDEPRLRLPPLRHPVPRPAPRANAPTLGEARKLLSRVFGYGEFRALQESLVTNVLTGRDSLGVMPTGSGKSLCYQLPALLLDGLTVVVSPLLALMQDQVDQLRQLGVPAVTLNSMLTNSEYVAAMHQARNGEAKLLYLAPETLVRPETLVLLTESRLALLTVDEAHCISEWGHDFRPEYRKLREIRARFPDAVCLALTATATPRVQEDISSQLGIARENRFIAPFDRPNLFLEVRRRDNGLTQVRELIERHPGEAGIVYCSTRDQVDTLVARLNEAGIRALPYHAGLDDRTRRENQRRFLRDDAPVMVATIAFGMGINKPDVRFVVHHNLPDCVETYYQQIGRGGRDGLRSECLLLFARADVGTMMHFVQQGAPNERVGRTMRLQAMVRYAEATGCRRAVLLPYFDDLPPEEACGMCDNCLAEAQGRERVDVSEDARRFLLCLQQTRQRFGMGHVIDVLRGSQSARVLKWSHEKLEAHGSGRHRPAEEWRQLGDRFLELGLVEIELEHGTLRITPAGRKVLDGEKVEVFLEARRAAGPAAAARPDHDAVLFESLRRRRKELADAQGVPPYVLFADRTLIEMACYYPRTREELLRLHGVGEHKATAYGEPFLELIREYVDERGVTPVEKPREEPRARSRPEIGTRAREVGEAFQSGLGLAELQERFKVVEGTVIQNLSRYQDGGGELDPDRVLAESRLDEPTRARVLELLEESGGLLGPVFAALNGEVPYRELHLIRMYRRALQPEPSGES